ncbi:hypothetical protein [Tropicibacter naphthalenivorans]|uniref:Thioredoxin-like fold domain-containing protein n=1 Tax=Tropicibacter naphthalenivorans TaxID=441103 RepID=A0A0P1G7Q6_9RHOB|nr:hypothetical protein [Tropicibacter naphthalenivorans]CUH77616.1 hypothetical protein TRN7648_01568 [Tropicibacter naphthalenivorans]SMC54934.1 Glutaredoxin [Tropicibacter naphthalenivorans]
MIRLAAFALLASVPLGAEAQDLRQRLNALSSPEVSDPYAAEKAADLARIAADAALLFPKGEKIAVFVAPDCPECDASLADLQGLGVAVNVLDIDDGETARLMARMTLDIVPSYVMPDRLIRGPMPSFVLARYLSD